MDNLQPSIDEWGTPEPVNDSNHSYKLVTPDLFPLKFFGQVDADKEWEENKDRSSKLFVHTESYDVFKHKSNLFIFGRRGTGKTALITMLNYEIGKGLHKQRYNYSRIIYQEDTLVELTRELRPFLKIFSDREMTHALKQMLTWVIHTTAMIAVVKKDTRSNNPHLINIRKYLADEKLIKSENRFVVASPIEKAVEVFSDSIRAAASIEAGVGVSNALKRLDSEEYREAFNSLVGYLNEKKHNCLVLIDSQDIYSIRDVVAQCVTTALIDAVLKIFNQYSTYRVLAKVAFPSEIVPHLRTSNRGKMADKEHFVFWKYDDLLEFISKRYCHVLKEHGYKESLDKFGKSDCDEMDDARDFIYQFLPKLTRSFSEVDLDSIAYILSHTQKKPREVIMLFNVILSMAQRNAVPFSQLTPECIREGTNARVADLSLSVLDMYRNIFPNGDTIIRKTFTNAESIMTFGQMHRKLTEASAFFGVDGMDKTKIENLFTESGVIGVVEDIRKLKDSDKLICEANFEYQIKNVMTLQSHDRLAIHPMFYQELNTRVYSNILVLPRPTSAERFEMGKLINN